MNERITVLREMKDSLKTESLKTGSESRYQAMVWVARLLDAAAVSEWIDSLPGADVPMTTEELRDTLGAIIHGHSRKDTTDWDLNLAMSAVERHVAYRLKDFLAKQAQEQTPPSEGDPMT